MKSDAAPHEIEAKFRVEDRASLESRLAELGAVAGPCQHETNVLLDDAAASLLARGTALRVREVGGGGLLTFKGPATMSGGVKSRLELESAVAEPKRVLAILGQLGFTPRFAYEKRRTAWSFPEPSRPLVVVDETPIGLFAEIEGDESAVRTLAEELRVPQSRFIAESYAGLYAAARRADPSLPPDMLFLEEESAAP